MIVGVIKIKVKVDDCARARMEEEKKSLLRSEEAQETKDQDSYGSTSPINDDASDEVLEAAFHSDNAVIMYLYTHRASIPGYGVLQIVKKGSVYALYVLFVLLMVYLFNQLDRYTLGIVTSSIGPELRYGDHSCMPELGVNNSFLNESGVDISLVNVSACTFKDEKNWLNVSVKKNQSICENDTLLEFENNGTLHHICRWWWDGTGILYQVVAGPVFNNLYPLAGIFTGFLADYGSRKIWLTISLVLWSLATGLTGFSQAYWHIVLLRALLAIFAAGCNPFAVSIIGDYFPAELRGSALGIYYWGIYIGYSLSYAIGNGIEQVLNWRWVFFFSGIGGIVVAPFVLFTVKEPKRTVTVSDKTAKEKKTPFCRRIFLILRTFIMPGMAMLCIAGGIRNAGGYVWAYNTEVFFEARGFSKNEITRFMSWIPIVGGCLGAVVGGLISDLLVRGRSSYVRIWVLIISQILAAPFAAGALFLPYPWCFLSLLPSNMIGEMWIGVTSAIVVDLAPAKIKTGVIAVYFFIITVIGGNFNLLVVPFQNGLKLHISELASYRWSLFLTFPGLYALSSLLFVFAFFLMRLDLKHKRLVDNTMEINEVESEPVMEEEEEGGDDGGSYERGEAEAIDKPV